MSGKTVGKPTTSKKQSVMGVFNVTPKARARAASNTKRKNVMNRLLDVYEGKRTTHLAKGNHD